MLYLADIEEKLNIYPEDIEAKNLLRSAFAFCLKLGIEFDNLQDKALAFANHILQLKNRLDQKEDFPEIDSSIADQVPMKYRKYADQLLGSLFPGYVTPFSEVVLVAIHLSVAAAEIK